MYLFLSGCARVYVCFCLTTSVSYFYFSLSLASLYSRVYFSPVSLPYLCFFTNSPSLSPPFSTLSLDLLTLFPSPSLYMAGVLLVLASASAEHAGVVHAHRVHCRSSPTPLRYSHIGALGQSAWDAEHQISLTNAWRTLRETRHTHLSGAHYSPADSQPETRQESPPAPGHWEAMLMSWMVS